MNLVGSMKLEDREYEVFGKVYANTKSRFTHRFVFNFLF